MDIKTLLNKLLSFEDEIEIFIFYKDFLISHKITFIDNIIPHDDHLSVFCDDESELQIAAPDIIEEDNNGTLVIKIGELSINIVRPL